MDDLWKYCVWATEYRFPRSSNACEVCKHAAGTCLFSAKTHFWICLTCYKLCEARKHAAAICVRFFRFGQCNSLRQKSRESNPLSEQWAQKLKGGQHVQSPPARGVEFLCRHEVLSMAYQIWQLLAWLINEL